MFKTFLDKLPSGPVIFFGGIYFFMPVLPAPHLWEKAMLIVDGIPILPIDYLDVVLHISGGALALAKYLRDRELAGQAPAKAGDGAENGAD